MAALLGCFGSDETLLNQSTRMTLSRKDASNIFVRKLLEMRKQIGVFVEYEAFDVRVEKLVNELHSSIQLEEHNANKKKKMLKNARNIHPPSGHHNPNQAPPRANKPKLKKQRSVDFTEAEQTGNEVVEEKPLKSIEKDGYKVKSLIDKFEKKIKTVANYVINKARDKTRERVIGKRKSKLSTLRKENKNRSIKQVNAFLNDTFHNPVVLVSVNSMFDTSHLDANMLIKHSLAAGYNGGTPSVKRPYIINHKLMQHHHSQNQKKMQELKMKLEFKTPNNLSSQITPKFVRFNETNTLKPYGSESTASTFAELCSSVMMSSNSIKSFKTANSTFDSNSSLRTPTHMTTACAGNSLRFEEFDHPPSCQRSFHMPPSRCNNLTVTISKNPISNSANSKRVTYCRLPQIAPRIKITTSEEEEYDEESGSGDEDFIDAPKQPTQNHNQNQNSHSKRITRIDSSDSPNRLTIVSSTATTTTTTTTVVKKRSSPASNRRSRSSSQGRNQYHFHHVNQSNYSIDELRVDDETDDEEEPRKPIPKWAQSDTLSHTSVRQAHKAIDFQQLFRAAGQTVRLEKVFPIVKNNFHVRSSSAEWPSPAAWRSNTLHQ